MSCPICARPTEQAWRPFCSRRCADVDLGRWLTGGYAIPAGPADEDAPASPAPPGPAPDPAAEGS
jgi:endogenous inhibitor of DNA gyrase (YacG/DUF329 family)